MPAQSEKQRKFFFLVKGVQQGKVSPKRVGSKVTKAAKSMSSKDVEDFTTGKNLPKKKLQEVIECLRGLTDPRFQGMVDPRTDLRTDFTGAASTGISPAEPMYLQNEQEDYKSEESNPIAKTFNQKGNFEQYAQKFSGLEIKPKEIESVTNYTNAKPTKQDKFHIRYENTDDFNNSTITVIKKLREGNDLVFTVFQSNIPQETGEEQSVEENDIVVNKSISFKNEIEGGKILADILQKLEI